jgi:hypothetical protein
MVMREKRSLFLGAVVLLSLVCVTSAFAVPTYMTLSAGSASDDYAWGTAEVYNNGGSYGLNYGKAQIEWHYWSTTVDSKKYWYYTYRIYNNEAGTANDRTDDYHYGHVYDTSTYVPINSFAIVPQADLPVAAEEDIVVTSALAGSSKGGGAWNPLVVMGYNGTDWILTDVDWSATRGGATGQTIDPTKWDYITSGQNKNTWQKLYSGDTSRTDSGSQYFQIASIFAPDIVTAQVSNGLVSSNTTINGVVYGPGVVPEPATCLLLGLGFFGLSSYRRRA